MPDSHRSHGGLDNACWDLGEVMNLHQKAKKIRREICNAVFADGISSGDMESVEHNILVKALQEVRREAIEECAKVADKLKYTGDTPDAIRSKLKEGK